MERKNKMWDSLAKIIRDSETHQKRFWDRGKIFRDLRFSSYHSTPLIFHHDRCPLQCMHEGLTASAEFPETLDIFCPTLSCIISDKIVISMQINLYVFINHLQLLWVKIFQESPFLIPNSLSLKILKIMVPPSLNKFATSCLFIDHSLPLNWSKEPTVLCNWIGG